MLKGSVCACLSVALAFPALAAKEYTPQQLRQMVSSGKFPPQGNPSEEQKSVPFAQCKSMVRSMMADVQPNYPVRTLMDVPAMLSMKMWANDAAVVMSCSQDNRLVVQSSAYR